MLASGRQPPSPYEERYVLYNGEGNPLNIGDDQVNKGRCSRGREGYQSFRDAIILHVDPCK